MQFRAFGIYVLPDSPAVDEGPVAQGDSTGDATIVLALQPLPLPRDPLAPGPEDPQPIDVDSIDDATDLTMSPWPSRPTTRPPKLKS
jgi:hypothetical protein